MSGFVPVNLEDVTVFVQCLDRDGPLPSPSPDGPQVQPTGIAERVEDAYSQAKATILRIASDMNSAVDSVPTSERPSELELEFSIGFSAEANAWVIGASNTAGFKVRMNWQH